MIEIAKILVNQTTGHCMVRRRIPAGLVGGTVSVEFDDPIWDRLVKTVVFRGTEVKAAEFDGKTAVIPWEVLEHPGPYLFFGIWGSDPDSALQLPLIEVRIGPIEDATDPDADPGTDPTLPIWAQLQQDVEELREIVGGGTGDFPDSGAAFYVTITGANGEYTSNKTNAEIMDAYKNGWPVNCIFTGAENDFSAENLILPLVMIQNDIALFGIYLDSVSWMVIHSDSAIQALTSQTASFDDIPQKLPNPQKLTFSGVVKGEYDGSRRVDIEIPAPKSVELDTTLTQSGKAADAKAVGDAISKLSGGNVDYVGIEPAYEDIPKIFFGGALQQTKDEAVVPFRYISKTYDFSGYAEIKAQGHGSMNYPKKNQNVKLFKDAECTEKLKVDFKGWGKQNKHCYKANWVDLTHARNIVSARLWGDVVKSRTNYEELPELMRTSPNHGAIDGFPVKVYAAGVYQGRYTLNIPKDKWMFNMDDDLEEHCVLCSENYGSGNFRAEANIDGNDWTDEIHDVVPVSIKTRWNEVISFVMNSTDDDFRANLSQYFFVDSLIDYYLYALAICGLDSLGRNQIFATYDGQRWIASAYDLDSTWGLLWNGTMVSVSYGRDEFEDMRDGKLGNLLYIRLEKLFHEELKARWAELRSGALSIENIINRFERFTDIAPAELVKEDYASTTGGGKFTGIPSQSTNNIQQIRAFALERQAWTDEYVTELIGGEVEPDVPDEPDAPDTGVPCTGITLDKTLLTFDGEGTQTITATVTPIDTTDTVVWVSSAPTVASISVEGNVCTVQSVANGDAVITVTCGEYSATCSVNVSGIEVFNLLEGVTWELGMINYLNGGNIPANDVFRSTPFNVQNFVGTEIVFFADGAGGDANRIVYYDANMNYVDYYFNNITAFNTIVPEGAVYARLCAGVNSTRVHIADCNYSRNKWDSEWNNAELLADKYFDPGDGSVESANGYCAKKLPIEQVSFILMTGVRKIVYFDSNDSYVGTDGNYNTGEYRSIVPENAAHVGVNYLNTDAPSVICDYAESRLGWSDITV